MSDRLDLEAFCQVEYPRLVGSLRLYCGSEDLAREFAQEALAIACANWRKVRRMESPGGWTNKVAFNLAKARFRRLAVEERVLARLRIERPEVVSPPTEADHLVVRDAVSTLPHREKTVLLLRYYIGLSVRETADVCALPEGTVKRLSHNAIDRLRKSALLSEKEVLPDGD